MTDTTPTTIATAAATGVSLALADARRAGASGPDLNIVANPTRQACGRARELWSEAYAMARRMIRARGDGHTVTDALTWFEHHTYRRFGRAAYATVIAAGSLIFHERLLTWGASGTLAELKRQGLVRRTRRPRPGNLVGMVPSRAFRFDRVRSCGISTAFTFDKLAAVHLRRSGRTYELRKRREAEACRFALTPTGAAALAAALAAAGVPEPEAAGAARA